MPEPEINPSAPTSEVVNATPVQEAVSAVLPPEMDNSANEDAVLDRLLGNDKAAPQQPVRTQAPAAPDPDFDRALKALQRDGVPADIIESIKSDPSKVKEWGLKAAKRQADVDSFGSKKANAEAKATEAPNSSPKASANTEDGESDADPLSEFGEIFGDDAVKPIRSLADRLRAEFDEKTRDIETRHKSEMAYTRIAAEYGQRAPSFDDVVAEAAAIGRENPGSFDSVESIFREAFRRHAGETKKADPRNIARPTIGKQPMRPVREIDREDAVLDILLSGGTRQDAFRIATR